jgi:hypothetical protein
MIGRLTTDRVDAGRIHPGLPGTRIDLSWHTRHIGTRMPIRAVTTDQTGTSVRSPRTHASGGMTEARDVYHGPAGRSRYSERPPIIRGRQRDILIPGFVRGQQRETLPAHHRSR